MKKIILKSFFVLLLVSVLLVVSCDSGVLFDWSGSASYTEVLETNGSFYYNENYYDNLSLALKDASGASSSTEAKEITVVGGDVMSRSVSLEGSDTNIVLDLNGNTLQFIDVSDAAISASDSAVLAIENGTLALNSSGSSLVAVSAEDGATVTITDLNIDATGKTAVLVNSAATTIEGRGTVKGRVIAKGGSSTTTLQTAVDLSDVRMQGATLRVTEEAVAEVYENSDSNKYVVATDSSAVVIDRTETNSIDVSSVEEGVCYVERNSIKHYYSTLMEAVENIESAGEEVVFFANQPVSATTAITLDKNITINLKNYTVGNYNTNITLDDGVALSFTGTGTFYGSVVSAEGASASLDVTGVTITNPNGSSSVAVNVSGALTSSGAVFSGSVTSDTLTDNSNSKFCGAVNTTGDMSFTGSVFTGSPSVSSDSGDISMTGVSGTAGAITSGSGKDISIDNSSATGTALTTGALDANGGNAAVKGCSSDYPVTVGGTVSSVADLVSSNAVFNGTVSAATVSDGTSGSTSDGSKFNGAVTASGDISLNGSSFTDSPSVSSDSGDISMTGVSGTAGAITSGSGKDISIDNSSATGTALTTGALNASDIDVHGYSSGSPVTVGGNVTASGALNSSNAVFNGSVSADTIIDGTDSTTANGSKFKGEINAGTSSELYGSTKVVSSLEAVQEAINYAGGSLTVELEPDGRDWKSGTYSFTSDEAVTVNFACDTDGVDVFGVKGDSLTLTFGSNITVTGGLVVALDSSSQTTLTITGESGNMNYYVYKYVQNESTGYGSLYNQVTESSSTSGTTKTSVYVPKVEITFKENGGSGTMSSQVVAYNTATPLTANAFTYTDYSFGGWATSSSATSATYTDGQNVTLTADTTLYAVWMSKVKVYFYTSNVALDGHDDDYYVELSVGSSFTGLPTATIDNENYSSYVVCGWKTVDDYYVESITVPAEERLTLHSIMCYTWTNTTTNSLILSYRPIFADTTSYQSVSTATGSKWYYTYYDRNEDYYYYVTTPSAKFYTEWNQKYWNLIYEVENAPEISTVYTEDLVKNLIGQKALWALASANHSGASSVTYNLTGNRYVTVTSSSMSFGDGNPSSYSLTSSYVWQTMDVVTE